MNGITLPDISANLHIHINTVRKYLKQGCKIFGWVKYDPQANIIENGKKSATYNTKIKPIKCNETNQVFASIVECERATKKSKNIFYRRYIWEVCCGIIQSYKGYTFKYITREEFNSIKTQSPELAFGDFFISTETNNQAS